METHATHAGSLFEAATEFLQLGMVGLALPRRVALQDAGVAHAAEIGLIGAGAELAVAACLTACNGEGAIRLNGSRYRSGREILESALQLLAGERNRIEVLLDDVSDDDHFVDQLTGLIRRMRLLVTLRAAGLHAGRGVSREVALLKAAELVELLEQLTQSAVFARYRTAIPRPAEAVVQRVVLIEDLVRNINHCSNPKEQATLITSLCLVLPELPDELPDWCVWFERLAIAPEASDIVFFLNTLNRALPVSLIRQSGNSPMLAVRVAGADDAAAVAVAPSDIRRIFSTQRGQWLGHVAASNGHAQKGIVHLPPTGFVQQLFVDGIDSLGLTEAGGLLPTQQTWPFILASLAVQGTPWPYWFLVRRTDDLKELEALLRRYSQLKSQSVSKRLDELIEGLRAIRAGTALSRQTDLYQEIAARYQWMQAQREKTAQMLVERSPYARDATSELAERVRLCLSGKASSGALMTDIAQGYRHLPLALRQYWARIIAEFSDRISDAAGLIALTKNGDLYVSVTAVRKSLRVIDFLEYGPKTYLREPSNSTTGDGTAQ